MDASPHDKFLVYDFPATLDEALAFEKRVGGPRFFLDLSNGDGGDGGEGVRDVLKFYSALGCVRWQIKYCAIISPAGQYYLLTYVFRAKGKSAKRIKRT